MMQKRTISLLAVMLILLCGYLGNWLWQRYNAPPPPIVQQPLPGKNNISSLDIHQDQSGRWIAEFDYFYTGQPDRAYIRIDAINEEKKDLAKPPFNPIRAARGSHHVSREIRRPFVVEQTSTAQVVVQLISRTKTIAVQRSQKNISWPNIHIWALIEEFAKKSPDDMYKHAVTLIDKGGREDLYDANYILERLIGNDPKFSPGYIELARIAMKTNWSPEGLHQAETLLASALKIQPDSANANILLGYVYTHQRRFQEAEALFTQVSQAPTKNLWLWSNWGELLVMEGKTDQGMQKYRQALAGKRPHDTYDRARLDAYSHLIALYEQNEDLDQAEALLKQRIAEFGNADCSCANHCFIANYVEFLIENRDDISHTIELGRKAINSNCNQDDARQALGLAYYATWAHNTNKNDHHDDLLSQARVYLPSNPGLLYLLATSDRTMIILKKLLSEGESLEQVDNRNTNALSYALGNRDTPAAKRLLKLGAKPDVTVTSDNVPLALIPVFNDDLDSVRLLVKSGVDYSNLRFNGFTAYDYAKRIGDKKLLKSLGTIAHGL